MDLEGLKDKNWYIELLLPSEAHMYGFKRIVKQLKTKYQDVLILDTFAYGRCLFLDGKIQSAQLDEFIYHEGLVHPALFVHPYPQKVFIGGGGEGASLREVLKHPCVKKLVVVDIDREVITLAKRYLFSWHRGSFEDSRVKLYFQDARKFLQNTEEKFDCIILDFCDPGDAEGPAGLLYTKEFYILVKKALLPDGIVVVQAGSTNLNMLKGYAYVYQTLRSVFRNVFPYQIYVPSFVGPWGFHLAGFSDSVLPSREVIERRIKERRMEKKFKFYSSQIHQNIFALPPYLQNCLKKGKVIYDRKPFLLQE